MSSPFEGPYVEPGEAAHTQGADPKERLELGQEARDLLHLELANAPVLDFERYRSDRDYRLYIFENPEMRRVQDDIIANALMCIQDHTRDFGLSSEQISKIIAIFEPGVRKRMAETQELETEMISLLKLAADTPIMRSLLRQAMESSEETHPGTSPHKEASEAQDGTSA